MSVYFKEKALYLEECFYSIETQTLRPGEIVLVEDGPLDDELYGVISKWEARLPIRRVILDSNVGLGIALNKGLEYCSFPLVARMDTDDLCVPDRFEKQVKIFNSQNVDVCGSWISEFESDSNVISMIRTLPESHSDLVSYSKFRNPMNHPSVMFRLDRVKSSGGYENVRFFEDYYLWLKLLSTGSRFYNIQEPLVNMRAGMNQLARRSGLSYAIDEYKFLYKSWKSGFLTFFQFSRCCILRVPVRVLPKNLLSKVYLLSRKTTK